MTPPASTASQLSAAYDAFTRLIAILHHQAETAGGLLPVLVTAAADAAAGRDAICQAPSLPAAGDDAPPPAPPEGSPAELADLLAGEARKLAARLAIAAQSAAAPGDRDALAEASRRASDMHACLAGTG